MTSVTMPYFSIIIPTYNSAGTIAACMDSILAQNFKDYEVLIMDGLSNDHTLKILENYGLMNLRIFSEKDQGVYDAMNKGVAQADGKYYYFLGSDDRFYDQGVLEEIAVLLQDKSPKILYGNVIMKGKHPRVPDGLVHGGIFDLKRLISDNICHQSIFYHHSLFDEMGNYNLRYPIFADHDLNLRFFSRYHFEYTDKIIAFFNLGGLSTQKEDPYFEEEKTGIIIQYFFSKLHTSVFVGLRLYVLQAARKHFSNISVARRLYCTLVYLKLKAQSLLP